MFLLLLVASSLLLPYTVPYPVVVTETATHFIVLLVHELEPLWTCSGFPTPRFSFLHALIPKLILKFNVVGFGPVPDRCPTDVCRYVTGFVA